MVVDWLLVIGVSGAAGGLIVETMRPLLERGLRAWGRPAYRKRLRAVVAGAAGMTPSRPTRVHEPEREVLAEPPRGPFLYLTELQLADLRCFAEASLSLRFPGEPSGLKLPNVNLLLGDNGSGKSTVLRAAAMAALGPILDSSGFLPYPPRPAHRSPAA